MFAKYLCAISTIISDFAFIKFLIIHGNFTYTSVLVPLMWVVVVMVSGLTDNTFKTLARFKYKDFGTFE